MLCAEKSKVKFRTSRKLHTLQNVQKYAIYCKKRLCDFSVHINLKLEESAAENRRHGAIIKLVLAVVLDATIRCAPGQCMRISDFLRQTPFFQRSNIRNATN